MDFMPLPYEKEMEEMKYIIALVLCLVISGCSNDTVDMLHPSRELANIPFVQEFDRHLGLTGQIKWIKEGILFNTYRFPKGVAPQECTEFFPAYVPEEMIGKSSEAIGLWYWCPDCEKWISCNYERCPICDRKMRRKHTSP